MACCQFFLHAGAYLILVAVVLQAVMHPRAIVSAAGEAWSAAPLREFVQTLWTEKGPKLPTQKFFHDVRNASFEVASPQIPGEPPQPNKPPTKLVILSMAERASFNLTLPIYLDSLRNITFTLADGRKSNLARHMVLAVLSANTQEQCEALATTYGFECNYDMVAHSLMSTGILQYQTAGHYASGFVRIKLILDALSMNTNVLFLDTDQVFFKNPLPYILSRDAEFIVTGEFCHQHNDVQPSTKFPSDQNIGFMYVRSAPLTTRCVSNWFTMMTDIAYRNGKPWDQGTFTFAVQDCARLFGLEQMRLLLASAQQFPIKCMGQCGCDVSNVAEGSMGRRLVWDQNHECAPEHMQEWVAFHFACNGGTKEKAIEMRRYIDMYQKFMGPVGGDPRIR